MQSKDDAANSEQAAPSFGDMNISVAVSVSLVCLYNQILPITVEKKFNTKRNISFKFRELILLFQKKLFGKIDF